MCPYNPCSSLEHLVHRPSFDVLGKISAWGWSKVSFLRAKVSASPLWPPAAVANPSNPEEEPQTHHRQTTQDQG